MTGTHATCDFCGAEGYWGRFGGHRALYIAAGGYHGFQRIAWICQQCMKLLNEGRLLRNR
jgi:hypothetical protein